jgi:hypothetical protein
VRSWLTWRYRRGAETRERIVGLLCSKLPALIEEARRDADAGMAVMGGCRLHLEEAQRPEQRPPGVPSG